MSTYRWRVEGRDGISHGSRDRFIDVSYDIEADHLLDALLAVVTNELYDTGVDTDAEVKITIAPVAPPASVGPTDE